MQIRVGHVDAVQLTNQASTCPTRICMTTGETVVVQIRVGHVDVVQLTNQPSQRQRFALGVSEECRFVILVDLVTLLSAETVSTRMSFDVLLCIASSSSVGDRVSYGLGRVPTTWTLSV